MRIAPAVLLLCALGVLPFADAVRAAQRVDAVCIVTEMAGKAQTQTERGVAEVALLGEFAPGARARLEAGARMVVLYVRTGEQFALQGPSLIRFAAHAPAALNGAEPLPLRPLRGKDGTPLRIRVEHVTQAAVVARSGGVAPIAALALSDTVALDTPPVLRWREPEPGLRYQIVLEDDEGATLLTRSVDGDRFALPDALALAAGAWYRWTISARGTSGAAYRSLHRFALADAATASAVANFRPPEAAPMAERVAYAAWLESAGLRDAAAAEWAAIARGGGQLPPARSALAAER
jgi:hypothetical protein